MIFIKYIRLPIIDSLYEVYSLFHQKNHHFFLDLFEKSINKHLSVEYINLILKKSFTSSDHYNKKEAIKYLV